VTFSATATDLVDGTDPVVFTEGNKVIHLGDTFGIGTHTITATATDAAGNIGSEQFTIKVQDTTPPTLTPVANQTDEATGASGAVATFSATATDLVDGTDPVVFTEGNKVVHSGDTFGIGTHTITATATDAAGNIASEPFTIKVQDTTPPTLTPVANQTVKATGASGAAVTFSATATDLVDGTDPVVFTESNTVVHSGDTFAIGGHTITATATDTHGNMASETFSVTVSNAFIVSSGQTLPVSAGKTSGGGLVLSGGTINVLSGGTAIGTTINKGGPTASPVWISTPTSTAGLRSSAVPVSQAARPSAAAVRRPISARRLGQWSMSAPRPSLPAVLPATPPSTVAAR
jgi:autotransporter passenger strand-loop-strand repeat protein